MTARTSPVAPILTRSPYGTVEASGSVDDLIRPSLRKAFPLPGTDPATDERIGLLLDAIRRCCPPDA